MSYLSRTLKFVRTVFMLALANAPLCAADTPCPLPLPVEIETTDDLRQHMEMMLQRSATFRQQCQRIVVPGVRIEIHRDPRLFDAPYRARTTFRRAGHLIVASVAIDAYGDPTEWLAHEIEHVIEQIDGVDVHQMAKTTAKAWSSFGNAFETSRAIRAGKVVVREVRETSRALARASKSPESSRGD
jgi:hypothetical protein